MRKLKTTDIPSFCRTVKKLGLKEKFKTLAIEANTGKDVWDRGFDLVWDLFDAATEQNGEAALYEFLAGPFEMTPQEVGDLDLDILFENIQHIAKENNLSVFFNAAAKLMMK